jgi:hypothetical protein
MSKELLARVKEERNQLTATLAGVNPNHQEQPVGNEGWSIKDILGLLASWEQVVTQGVEQAVRGEEVKALQHLGEDKQRQFFQEKIESKRGWSQRQIKDDFESAWESLFEVLLDLPPASWEKPEISRLVQSVADTYRAQRESIEAWKERGLK